MKYYAVFKGRKTGVFTTWPDCQAQVKKYPGCKYKSFSTLSEAEHFSQFGNAQDAPPNVEKYQAVKRKNNEKIVDFNNIKKLKLNPESKDISKTKLISNVKFIVDERDSPVVYTDGACQGNGKVGCKAGYGVWWGDDHKFNTSKKLNGIQTNQRAEIAAIHHAINQAIDHNLSDLTIRTDSKFVINCLTTWCKKWVKNGWKSTSGQPVIHKIELSAILEDLKNINITWEHVRGHCGIYGNEKADELAVKGISL